MIVPALVLVFAALWIALYVLVIRPKLEAFRATAGIYAALDAWEHGFWSRCALWLKGLKVAIVGFVTSSAPVAAVFYDRVAGLDWSRFLSSDAARTVATVVAICGIVGPMLMVLLHQSAIAEAAATEPRK